MFLDRLAKVRANLFGDRRRKHASRPARRWGAFSLEALESRQLLTASATYVNDDWAFDTDVDSSASLTNADLVTDGTTARQYGVTAFGTVTSGTYTGSVVGSSMITNAIDATTPGGATWVLNGSYSGDIDLDQPVTLYGSYTVNSGSDLWMSNSGATIALNGATSNLTLTAGDANLSAGRIVFAVDSSGNNNQLVVNGSVSLSGASLDVDFRKPSATVGSQYTIIDNDGTDPISGTFAGLPEGALIRLGERTLQVTYVGGSGNDVLLEVVSQNSSFTTYINDNWYDVYDGDDTPVAGHFVDDSLDTGGSATVNKMFEQTYNDGFYSAAYDDVQQAVDAVGAGGSVYWLPGSYTGDVTINRRMGLQLNFDSAYTGTTPNVISLAGNLDVSGVSGVSIVTGNTSGTLNVEDLTLGSDTTLTLKAGELGNDLINVDGALELNGAQLKLKKIGEIAANTILIDNLGAGAVVGTFANLPEGESIFLDGKKFWITYQGGDGNDVELIVPNATVAGRYLFYNDSKHDGNTSGVSTSDDNAIAPDKQAQLPGDTGAFANVSSYSKGINGIMIDLDGSHPNLSAADFEFAVSTANTYGSWSAAPAPTAVSVRAGAGVGGSDRVEIIWANGAISNSWLQVSLLSTANSGLASPDVFLFGNRIGDTGLSNSSAASITNVGDQVAIRNNGGLATISNIYDIDRNGVVSAGDELAARNNSGVLFYLTMPAPPDAPPIIQMFTGTKRWTPDAEVVLTASLPVYSDGAHGGDLVDPDVDRVDFYLDVNRDGLLDAGDVLLDQGEELVDGTNPRHGWEGRFTPTGITDPNPVVLAVPVDASNNPLGVGATFAAVNAIFQDPPVFYDLDVSFTLTPWTAVSAAALSRGVLTLPSKPLLWDVSPNSTGVTGASAGASGGGSDSFGTTIGSGNSFAIATNEVVTGTVGGIHAVTSSAAAAVVQNGIFQAVSNAQAIGNVGFVVNSANAPTGTPVMLTFDLLAWSYANGSGDGGAAASIQLNNGNGPNTSSPSGPAGAVVSVTLPIRVGQQVGLQYDMGGVFRGWSQAVANDIQNTGIGTWLHVNELTFEVYALANNNL